MTDKKAIAQPPEAVFGEVFKNAVLPRITQASQQIQLAAQCRVVSRSETMRKAADEQTGAALITVAELRVLMDVLLGTLSPVADVLIEDARTRLNVQVTSAGVAAKKKPAAKKKAR